MSLLTLSEVHKSYGNQDVLCGASFFVSPGKRTGLVGPNGAGKSTILRLVVREIEPDRGHVTLQPNARVAMLSQEPLLGDARTVLEAAQRPTRELQEAWHALRELEGAAADQPSHLERYDEALHRYQDLGGYDCENRAKEILAGLGFPEDTWEKPVTVLSGGERTRLALVQILVVQPDLLLLDEPTNHVDWTAAEWLQEYLLRYPGAALIVSHDRYFLDQVAQEIVELAGGKARTYAGNYTAYARKKEIERQQAEEAYQRRQEEIARQEAVIQRLRSHRKFDSMHSREKVLDRLKSDSPEKPREPRSGMRIHSREVQQTGREALSARGLEHGFGNRCLFRGLDLTLERGDRLAIVGPNGAGKSTLLKCLAGELAPHRGQVTYGYRAQPAYFAQDLSSLDPEATVWETLWDTGALDLPQTMQALHQFLFAGEAVEKLVGSLSGGERTRLALCRLLVTRPNLLLLDEPTNHLDIPSREAVERALRSYPGGVVVVSHDRYFLEAVATRMLELREGGHRFFDGSYSRYRERLTPPSPPPPARKPVPSRDNGAPNRPEKQLSPNKRLPRLEAEISRCEARQKELAELLARPETWTEGHAGNSATSLSAEFDALTPKLEALYAEWEEVAALASR